ncbi:hypothetical protein Semix9P1_phi14 [Clostridioides phage phiSemix9P1]|nr:hypothetical protein Semix9P1_phi14 [Clostridioides phage phiSemix9P1]MCC0646183.1 hypothetical protein [Clostridioides sp. ZZV14-6150]MCC0724001.1 hypothetical protein [Clostridioides sp. ZZV14-6104]MCC0724795.1 hypothetical protein [Clostridioides sp. ZZV14-6045]MCC0732241.1 hypothetical protein [Clostridioides sp. ZZV14-6048]MCC0736378.1 hypothetical protein [Clostridioides sp. ZZV14-6009]MCC0752105.1 hypothetical protein [Clostridioides sp. ZZV13-5731]
MYLLFKYKGIMPSVSFHMLKGETKIVSVFMDQELDERKEEIKFGAGRLF